MIDELNLSFGIECQDPARAALMPIVRAATDADEQSAQLLAASAFDGLRSIYRPTASARASTTAVEGSVLRLVAIEAGQLMGTARYEIKDAELYLFGLAVDADHRRRGVAKLLLSALERIASAAGCRKLLLCTVKEAGLVPVFERCGFRVVRNVPAEKFESPAGESLTETYMERALAGHAERFHTTIAGS